MLGVAFLKGYRFNGVYQPHLAIQMRLRGADTFARLLFLLKVGCLLTQIYSGMSELH